jgi:rhodanese-related sulfurtransferase
VQWLAGVLHHPWFNLGGPTESIRDSRVFDAAFDESHFRDWARDETSYYALFCAGFTNVRRYQRGIPVWRALGGVCEMDAAGLQYVLAQDRTAVLLDVREADEFRKGALPGARNIPRTLVLEGKDVGEIKRAQDDGRLPMESHNTRVVVLGSDAATARYVAEAIAREAFHNVTCFPGAFDDARAAVPK